MLLLAHFFMFLLLRDCLCPCFWQVGGMVLLFVTVTANVWFLMDTAAQLREHQAQHHSHLPEDDSKVTNDEDDG